jgi:hypothetical protein
MLLVLLGCKFQFAIDIKDATSFSVRRVGKGEFYFFFSGMGSFITPILPGIFF